MTGGANTGCTPSSPPSGGAATGGNGGTAGCGSGKVCGTGSGTGTGGGSGGGGGHHSSSVHKNGTHSSELLGEEEEETLRICYNHIGVHFSCYLAHPHLNINSTSTHNNNNNNHNNSMDNHTNNNHQNHHSSSGSKSPPSVPGHPPPLDTNGPLLVVSPGVWHHLVVSVDYTETKQQPSPMDQPSYGQHTGAYRDDTKVGGRVGYDE